MGFLDDKKGYETVEKRDEEAKARRASKTPRFWLKVGETARVIFLDDEPPIINEHQFKRNGSWNNYKTCLKEVGEYCEACDVKNPYTAGFYTIIDTRSWNDNKGNSHKNEKKLFVPKLDTLKKLKKKSANANEKNKGKGLRFIEVEVFRSGEKSPSTGDDFEIIKIWTEDDIKAILPKGVTIDPLNYEEILKPVTAAEMKAFLQGKEESDDTDNESGSGNGGYYESGILELNGNNDEVDF